jgi:hypothetical protein
MLVKPIKSKDVSTRPVLTRGMKPRWMHHKPDEVKSNLD